MAGVEGFPRDEVLALIRRLPAYARLAWHLGRDPQVPALRRALLLGGTAYLVSPIDAVPGIIPIVGQLDDILVMLVALRIALAGLSVEQRRRLFESAGLSEEIFAADTQTLSDVVVWTARTGARAGVRASRLGLEATVRISEDLGRLGRSGLRRLRR